MDKVFPIFRNKGDITNAETGRDLILSLALSKAGTGKEYTTINSVIPEDIGVLHTDADVSDKWVNDELTWSDVYSKKGEDYLELVARGEAPRWDNDLKKYVSTTSGEETFGGAKTQTPSVPAVDPQVDEEVDEDLPF
jgi:hypothetical protein